MPELVWPIWVWCCGAEDGDAPQFIGPYDDEYTCSEDALYAWGSCTKDSYADRGDGNADALNELITTSRTHAWRKFEELDLLKLTGMGIYLELPWESPPDLELRYDLYNEWLEKNESIARQMFAKVR